MSTEQWHPIPGYVDAEVSSLGRVRTTATGTQSSPVTSLALLLLFLAVIAVYNAHVVNTVATVVTLALCAVPVSWLVFQCLSEIRFTWECRRYRHPVPARPVARQAITRGPLAIEAARPVVPCIIEAEAEGVER